MTPRTHPSVLALSATSYAVECAACGATCERFLVDVPAPYMGPVYTKPQLLHRGMLFAGDHWLDEYEGPALFALLAAGGLAGVHAFLTRFRNLAAGMESYCPSCDRCYCRAHFSANETWGDGFVERIDGRCPRGHERALHIAS